MEIQMVLALVQLHYDLSQLALDTERLKSRVNDLIARQRLREPVASGQVTDATGQTQPSAD